MMKDGNGGGTSEFDSIFIVIYMAELVRWMSTLKKKHRSHGNPRVVHFILPFVHIVAFRRSRHSTRLNTNFCKTLEIPIKVFNSLIGKKVILVITNGLIWVKNGWHGFPNLAILPQTFELTQSSLLYYSFLTMTT